MVNQLKRLYSWGAKHFPATVNIQPHRAGEALAMIQSNTHWERAKTSGKACMVAFSVSLSSLASATPVEFKAEYGVHYLRVRAADVHLTLEQIDSTHWTMHRRSRAAGVARWLASDKLKVDERSWFQIENARPIPSKFERHKPGSKPGRKHLEINFGQENAKVTNDTGEARSYPRTDGSQDQVSAVLAVMLKVQQEKADFKLPIVDRRGEDMISFKVLERTTLKTPAGSFKTIHIVQKKKNRTTDYWLALDNHMVPVKIVHKEEGKDGAEMKLEKLSFQ